MKVFSKLNLKCFCRNLTKSATEIPGPSKIVTLVDMLKTKKSVSQLRHQWFEKYGNIVRFSIVGQPCCVAVRDPKDIKQVYMASGAFPERIKDSMKAFIKMKEKLGYPLTLAELEGEEWKERRKIFHPLLNPDYVKQFVPRVSQVATDWVSFLKRKVNDKGELHASDLITVCSSFSFEAFSSIILGLRMGLLYEKELHPVIKEFVKTSLTVFSMLQELLYAIPPLWNYIDTPLWKKWISTWQKIYDLGKIILTEKDKFNLINDGASSFEAHVKAQKLSPKEIECTIIDLVFAGVDTTENALVWSLLRLAREKEAQEKIHEEVISIVPYGLVRAEQLEKMKFLWNCFKEIQRTDPFIGANVRVLSKDINIKGYNIPSGTPIFLDLYSSNKCPQWVHNPEEFDPDRHERKECHPFLAKNFGFGARQCAGKRMAEMEIQLALAHLLREYRMKLQGEIPVMVERSFLSPDFSKSDPIIKFQKRCN